MLKWIHEISTKEIGEHTRQRKNVRPRWKSGPKECFLCRVRSPISLLELTLVHFTTLIFTAELFFFFSFKYKFVPLSGSHLHVDDLFVWDESFVLNCCPYLSSSSNVKRPMSTLFIGKIKPFGYQRERERKTLTVLYYFYPSLNHFHFRCLC